MIRTQQTHVGRPFAAGCSRPREGRSADCRLACRAGFTLTELIVVITLMVILIGLAVPTFRLLSGNRSIENASNIIGAMLARARADAVGLQEIRGVVIYEDITTGRTAAAFVEVKATPFNQWINGTDANPITHARGEYVTDGTNYYVCLADHTDSDSSDVTLANTDYWRALNNAQVLAAMNGSGAPQGLILDLVADRDRQFLPKGIDVRGAGDRVMLNSNFYRYYNPAIILFDGSGSLVSRPAYILTHGLLGADISTDSAVPAKYAPPRVVGTINTIRADSQVGFVMVDEETFLNATATFAASPEKVDAWLDENATPVLVNRYNGTLVKGD